MITRGAIPLLRDIRSGARGVIGALAQRGGQTWALTARHLLEPRTADSAQPIQDSIDLIGMVPLPRRLAIGGKPAEGGCANPEGLLGQSVYRFCAGRMAPGKVTTLHGALRLMDPHSRTSFTSTDVIEVAFDETCASGPEDDRVYHPMPVLSELDAGALVITWSEKAVGIIVAGGQHRAFAAPLAPFLQAHRLTLVASPALISPADESAPRYEPATTLTLACNSLVDDLAREPSLEFDLEEAA